MPVGTKTCILVVENEPLIRFDAVDIFERAGFEVEEASDAEDALRIMRSRPDLHVLFTDVHMPGPLDGLALAHIAARDHGHVSLIIVSGRERPHPAALPDKAVFFPKPYEARRIVEQVHLMLQDPTLQETTMLQDSAPDATNGLNEKGVPDE